LDVDWELIAFLILSAFEVIGSILVVVNKRMVRAAFWLAMTLVTIGVIYLLFLSGIMLTRRKIMDEPPTEAAP